MKNGLKKVRELVKSPTTITIVLVSVIVLVLLGVGLLIFHKTRPPAESEDVVVLEPLQTWLTAFGTKDFVACGLIDGVDVEDDGYFNEQIFEMTLEELIYATKTITVESKDKLVYNVSADVEVLNYTENTTLAQEIRYLNERYIAGEFTINEYKTKYTELVKNTYYQSFTDSGQSKQIEGTLELDKEGNMLNTLEFVKKLLDESGLDASTKSYETMYEGISEQIMNEVDNGE